MDLLHARIVLDINTRSNNNRYEDIAAKGLAKIGSSGRMISDDVDR